MNGAEEGARAEFLADALAGLSGHPKTLPGKYLWDETGSDLFDRICAHPDYYPTKREMALLPGVASEVAPLVGSGVSVVEFGSGASRKIRTLLDALDAPAAYVALDISKAYLESAIERLAAHYPGVTMTPVTADYSKPVRLPPGVASPPILGFFPGTSIGNFTPDQAGGFLGRARETLGPSHFLVGADPTRDAARLRRAYGESGGLMAALHLNLFERLNRELGADFDRDNFRHEARLAEDPFRVEAHLVAIRPASYRLGDRTITVAAGESIRTDTSHKYPPDVFRTLAAAQGWEPVRQWIDEDSGFSLHLFRA
ncbi:L-histidine N(alpha)-methyltransferase [Methylorubrum zatmanii]|uniref:L-histidine N(Alpha)-methyltransferase n=1 Tax=Methylorubrum zatmanii TaxID=29429 RepID=A0ABW1WQJ2_9HYPH|nr:L-histidine N(alpha)-methyltransferase [Methylorubrum zatmanii]MBD8907334.1 L-histidine N(alpha)-methyltransferase [Methylorubrum zatmanii]